MNDGKMLPEIILEQFNNNLSVVLASIVKQEGSSPRHGGTKMIIKADGQIYGTIGGSLLEATTILESKKVLLKQQAKFIEMDIDGGSTDSKGMICGGKVTVLLDYLDPSDRNREFLKNWQNAILRCKSYHLLTRISKQQKLLQILERAILFKDGQFMGKTSLSESDIRNLQYELRHLSETKIIPIQETLCIADPIDRVKTLYCFGAGHVAVPTVHIAAMSGFQVVVIDDRIEFANSERFPDARSILVIEDFNRATENLEIDEDSYIIILTRGHQFDREVLEQALKTRAGYIGMISSRKKRDMVYEALLAKGFKKEDLEKVHSPIGLPIEAETPEEIAVSIVAELIVERAQQRKNGIGSR